MIGLIPNDGSIGVSTRFRGLVWYELLADNEKQKADRIARQLGVKLYRQSVHNVTPEQARRIETIVRERMDA